MLMRPTQFILAAFCALLLASSALRASNTERLEAFLEVTGFDVALESIKLSADSAPAMVGLDAGDFGAQWQSLVDEVVIPEDMHTYAVDMLSQTLEPELLDHAVEFYASDLGQRLVQAENASHMVENEALKRESGEAIVAGMVRFGAPRLEELKRLNAATGSTDASIHAIHEIQVRFLMAAAASGVIELQLDEEDLRESLARQEGDLRRRIQANGLTSSAYTYQAFSDAEVTAYADALEDPRMQKVYALMNAVQFQIMADLFETLALRMQELRPSQEL